MQYSKQKIIEAIVLYEENNLKKKFELLLSDSPVIILFTGSRSKKISVLSTHLWPVFDINRILNKVINYYDTYNNLSDTISYYSTAPIDSSIESQLKEIAITKYDINLDIKGVSDLKQITEFSSIINDETVKEDELTFVEKSLYDYLASGEDSSYLKTSLYYSLILLCLYNHQEGLSTKSLSKC